MVMMLKSSVLFTNEKMPSLIVTKGAISSSGMLGKWKEEEIHQNSWLRARQENITYNINPYWSKSSEEMDSCSFCYTWLFVPLVCDMYTGRWRHALPSGDALWAGCWWSCATWHSFNREIRPIKALCSVLWPSVLRNASRWFSKHCQSRLNWFLVSWGDQSPSRLDTWLVENGSPAVSFHLLSTSRAFSLVYLAWCFSSVFESVESLICFH